MFILISNFIFITIKEAKILIIGMPSHTSADLQPLDVAMLRAVKAAYSNCYRAVLLEHFQDGEGMQIDYWDLPNILNKAWVTGASKDNCIAGFRATGIWPRQLDWIEKHEEVLAPSALFFKCEDVLKSSGQIVYDVIDDNDDDDVIVDDTDDSPIPSNATIDTMMNFMNAGISAKALALASSSKLHEIA